MGVNVTAIDWTKRNAPRDPDEGPEEGDTVRCDCCGATGVLGEDIEDAPEDRKRSPWYNDFICSSCMGKIRKAEAEEEADERYRDRLWDDAVERHMEKQRMEDSR